MPFENGPEQSKNGSEQSNVDFGSLAGTEREHALFEGYCREHPDNTERFLGRVVRLDRGFPLVCCEKGNFRAEHAISVIKQTDSLSCAGDWVVLALPEGHDNALIEAILPRRQVFIRRDPAERTGRQVLAANIDIVLLLHALSNEHINIRRLEREMVSAYDSGAMPVVVLTKADLAKHLEDDVAEVRKAVPGIEVIVESVYDGRGIDQIRALIGPTKTAVLLGSSGVGKSALTNALVGADCQRTGSVRAYDNKGRHTTVSRDLLVVRGGGVVIDTPGIRAIALWNAEKGFMAAFPEIADRARQCRFSDCTHTDEPGCAVLAAVRDGEIERRRLESYQDLRREVVENETRRDEKNRLDGKKHGQPTNKGVRKTRSSSRRKQGDIELQRELDEYHDSRFGDGFDDE